MFLDYQLTSYKLVGGEGASNLRVCMGTIEIQIHFEKTSINGKYWTKYNNVTSLRQEKCTRKYVTICILMALELHAPSPPSAAHKLLAIRIRSLMKGQNSKVNHNMLYMYICYTWAVQLQWFPTQ